jgi:tetratricopeptide (TPR) repeat protein
MFHLEAGDTAKALEFFEQSRKVTPNDKDLAYYHGVALGLSGHLDQSIARFKDAIALDPDDGQSYFAAYSICRDSGRYADAADFLRMWVTRHPDDTQAGQLLHQLEAQMVLGGPPDSAPGIVLPGGPGGPGGIVPGGAN